MSMGKIRTGKVNKFLSEGMFSLFCCTLLKEWEECEMSEKRERQVNKRVRVWMTLSLWKKSLLYGVAHVYMCVVECIGIICSSSVVFAKGGAQA